MAKPSSKVMEKLKKYREKLKTGGNWFQIKDGETPIVRVLPPKNPEDFFFKEVGQHYFNETYYICPRITNDEPCPFCETADELRGSGEKEDKELAKDFSPSRKWIIFLVDRSDARPTIRPFRSPKAIIDVLTRDYLDEDYGDILDPMEGRDYKFERTGAGKASEYDASPRPKVSALLPDASKEEVKEFLEKAPDMDSLVEVLSYEDLKKVIEAGEDPDEKDDKKKEEKDPDEKHEKEGKEDKKEEKSSDLRDRIRSKLKGKSK